MDSLSCKYNTQEIVPEPKNLEELNSELSKQKTDQSSKYLLFSFHRHTLKTVRITCEGNLHDPNFPRRLRKLISKLKALVSNENKQIKVINVEPWNSVRVTFNLSNDAAQRLRQLAELGDANLRELGILSVQIEGQQIISLMLQPNANQHASINNNIDQVNIASEEANNNSIVNSNKDEDLHLKKPDQNELNHDANKYLFRQVNGGIVDESSNSSGNNNNVEQSQISDNTKPKTNSISFGSNQSNSTKIVNKLQSMATSSVSFPPPYTSVPCQQPQVYLSQQPRTNNLHIASNQLNLNVQSQAKSNFISHPTNTSNSSEVSVSDSNLLLKKAETNSGLVENVNTTPVMIQQVRVQNTPFSSGEPSLMAVNPHKQFTNRPSSGELSRNLIRNVNSLQFNGPRPLLISSAQSPKTFISPQTTVPLVSKLQSQSQPMKSPEDSVSASSHSSVTVSEQSIKPPMQQPHDHNANYVNSSTFTSNTLYPSSSTILFSQPSTSAHLEPKTKNFSNTSDLNSQSNSGDILGSSVDGVDDEDLLASVTGANSIDLNNFTDLNDLNLLSMLEEMESANHNTSQASTTTSSLDTVSTTSSNDSNQINDSKIASTTTTTVLTNVKNQEFRSPNVVAPQSTQPLPFFISQQQQQQSSTKVGTTVVSGAKQILINSSTGAVLSQPQAHQLSQQIMEASTTTAAVSSSLPTSSTLYPFTSMQHASLFTAKQQPQPHQPNVPSSPRHVYLPVRQIPAVRAAASQQVPQQSQSMVRALQPSVANPTTDQMVQHSPQQTNLYRPSNSLIRQPLPSNSSNSSNLTSPIQNKSQQQQQLVIRQNVPYSSSQQSTPPPSGQQNTVALSSPLLVNLLQSDVQQSNPLQQNLQPHQQQFVAQPGTQQIRFIQPGSHGDGTPLMMMVRVSSAPQGSTTQLINPATFVGAMPSGVQSSQMVTSIASHVMDQQANTIQSIESSSSNVSNTKAKKPRKPRKTKNQVDNKADGSVPSGIVTTIQQVTTAISSGGAITSIPLSLATSSPSRTQTSSVSTILSFPTSSLTQSFKLQATPPKSQQTILSGQTSTVSQHLFNQKQRVQPVVMIATSNANISDSANVSSSNTIATSKNAFIITNVAASSLGTNSAVSSSTTTTTTAGVQLSGKRKRILLATKSNSFPVSSALSAGAIMARVSNNLTSSTSTIASSPVKLVSQSMPPSSVPFVMTSSNSACLLSSESSITSTSSNSSECKSSLASMSSSVSLSSNLTSMATTLVTSVSNITPVSNSDLTTVSQMPSLPTNTAINVNTPHKMSISSALPSQDSFSMSSGTQSMIATPNMLVKGYQIPSNVPGNANNNSLLLNKLNQSNTSTCKILASSFKQMANKSPMKTIAVPVSQLPPAFQKQMLAVAITEEKNKERNLSVSNTSDSIPNHPHESKMSKCVSLESLLTSTETKQSILTKSISDAGFKLSLTDVLGSSGGSSNASKLDPVFLSGDDDPDRIAEPEAPISPSYFLAPPPAFENKPNVDDASNVQSETKTEPSDSTNKDEASKEQQKLDNSPLLKSEQVSQSTSQSIVSLSTASKSIPTTEQSSSSTTITTTSAIKSSPTVTTSVKLHDDVQTKSNCSFDSFSYFMSKHSYSQDLPDHILEDDEDGDDSDNDDFGLYPKSSHFLSGSVGSIGRNNSIAVSSTPTIPVVNISSTSSNVLPLSVASSSTPSSSTITDQKINSDKNKSDNKQENVNQVTEAISKNIPESIPVQKDLNENKPTVHDDKKSIENVELVKDGTILKKNEKESQPSSKSDIRTLMNGDIFQSLANESDSVDTKNSNVVQVSHCLTSITCNSMESNPDSSTKQYPTINIVASKSYPLLNAATKNNPSNVPQNPNEPSSINYSEPAVTTDKQSNLVETQSLSNEIQSNVSELTPNVTKNTKSRKTPSQPSATKLTQPNKNRRKPVTSVSTMSQTIAVLDSLYQTQNTATKSELHSLLASPTMTTKSNVSLDSVSSTSLSETLSSLTSSSETSCTPQRQVYYTFKQPNQTISTNSSQTITSQTTDCTSTQVPTSTTFLKVLMPGVNNIAGNKLLTIATASSSANSSTNSSTISAQTLTSSIASHNPSESSSSQKPAMPSVFGRYYVNGPSGPQLVVFKPVMINDTRNATSSASMTSSQLKFTALQSKFSSVSGSSTSQPLIIPMVTSSTGQTILSMPPDIQATSSIESSNSHSSALNENEPKKFIARKTNTPNNHQSFIPAEPSVLLQQPNYSQQQQTCVSQATPLESTSISDGEIKPVTSLPNVTVLDNSDNLNGPTTEVSKTGDDKSVKGLPDASSNRPSNGSQSVSSSNSINSSMKVIPSVVEKVSNKTDTGSICEDKRLDNLQNPSKQQQPNVSETTTKTSNDKIETRIDNSFVKNEIPNVASKVEIKPIVTSSPLVLPSIELTPVTTSASTNSNVALRTDTTRLKEAEKELSGSPVKINSRSNSPIGTRRPILLAKSSVGLHSQVSQLQTSQDLISNAIFATKSSGASITATKTLPTILRQSKRKADNFYQTSQSILNSSEQSNKIPQQNADYQASSDLAETFEMENSATTSMVSNPSNFAFRNHSQPVSSEHNFSSPAIEFVDEISDHTGSDQIASRPRKRARKSKMTTLQQPANAGDLSTSLLLNEYNDVPIEISDDKTDSSDIEIKRSTTPTSSRVLRNSSSVSSTPSKSSVNKRGQRNNRSMLAHNSTTINISNAPSSPILLASDSTDDLVLKTNDKSKKAREVSSKVGSRQTRSNRNKIKRLEPSMISDSNPEIIISDNAVDEQLQLDMNTSDAEFMSSLVAENSHETMASSSASVASSSMNQQININANTSDQRSISILDSGNSNSSTASSNSSSNSLLIKRPRKSLSASATKPSLRSNSASETLASPITPTKRRRIAKETAK